MTLKPNHRHRGFSLLEIIATSSVILLLAAMVVPMANKVSSLRDNVTCSSNLRQIGLGILAYAQDNDNKLPGPMMSGQSTYSGKIYYQLSHVLREYLPIDASGSKRGFKDVFVCPAMKKKMPIQLDTMVYGINIQVPMEGWGIVQPFGYPHSQASNVFGKNVDVQPMKLSTLSAIRDMDGNPAQSTTWALRDIDRLDQRFDGLGKPKEGIVSDLPVHGDRRMTLFFDFHVAPEKVVEKK